MCRGSKLADEGSCGVRYTWWSLEVEWLSQEEKCPMCGELLSRDSVIHHLCVLHRWGLRDAKRWAGLYLGFFAVSGETP
jgi:hypothetical protein